MELGNAFCQRALEFCGQKLKTVMRLDVLAAALPHFPSLRHWHLSHLQDRSRQFLGVVAVDRDRGSRVSGSVGEWSTEHDWTSCGHIVEKLVEADSKVIEGQILSRGYKQIRL